MDIFSMELGIRLSFVKTSEFRGGGLNFPNSPLGMPLSNTTCFIPYLRRRHVLAFIKPSSGHSSPYWTSFVL
jgi:hypothetical protein